MSHAWKFAALSLCGAHVALAYHRHLRDSESTLYDRDAHQAAVLHLRSWLRQVRDAADEELAALDDARPPRDHEPPPERAAGFVSQSRSA